MTVNLFPTAVTQPHTHTPTGYALDLQAYVKQFKQLEQEAARIVAVFPCVLKIMPTCIFNKKDPIVLGVEVSEGIAKVRPLPGTLAWL